MALRLTHPRTLRRHWPAWLLIALAQAILTWGIATGQALLVTVGIVIAAAAGRLFQSRRSDVDRH